MGAFNELIIEKLGADEEFVGFEIESSDVSNHDENQLELVQFSPPYSNKTVSECTQVSVSNY